MGLLKHLLFWPVTGPLLLARFSLDRVEEVVHRELTDDTKVQEELLELQLRLELGEIDEETFAREEAALMERLQRAREWRERLDMGTRGGPVTALGSAAASAEVVVDLPEGDDAGDEAKWPRDRETGSSGGSTRGSRSS